ncbi:MAG TPA: GntR family transcriptional regulator [Terriglobales bacterium]|nr:GntR family transcriptional regulator [Terriglobales bacterium]
MSRTRRSSGSAQKKTRKITRRIPLSVSWPAATPASGNGAVSLGDRVYRAMKHDIVTGIFQSGEALSENILAKRYRASRTPVREAAVRLQQEHLLRIVPNRGYFVRHMTINELVELYEFRAALEGACAELAARKGADETSLEQLWRLGQIHFERDDRQSYERFIEADTSFHIGLAQLTRNQLLLQAVRDVRCQMERIMYAAIDIHYYGESPANEHAGIIQAIREHDAVRARQLMEEHIFISKDKVLQLASNSRVL